MISGPFEFVIGTADLQRTASFVRVFGFNRVSPVKIDKQAAISLYGCAEAEDQLVLSSDTTATIVRLVQTQQETRPMQAFEAGGHGIDFYTTDIARAIALAADAGGSRPTPVSWTIDTGRHLTEARIVSPDGAFSVFCVSYSAGGIPSILDSEPDRLFSEVSLTSWIIPADLIEAEFAFWNQEFGYENIRRTMLSEEAMVGLMQLPRPAAMGCSMFADDSRHCPVDILWYPGLDMKPRQDWPLRPGLFALGFTLAGKAAGSDKDEPQSPGTVVLWKDDAGVEVKVEAGRSPGGIRFHLYS